MGRAGYLGKPNEKGLSSFTSRCARGERERIFVSKMDQNKNISSERKRKENIPMIFRNGKYIYLVYYYFDGIVKRGVLVGESKETT